MKKFSLKYTITNFLIYIFGTEILTYMLVSSPLVKLSIFNNKMLLNILLLAIPVFICITLIFINRYLYQDKFKDFKENFKKYLPLMIKYYICGLILMVVTSTFIQSFTHAIPENEAGNQALIQKFPIYSLISIIITAPISEEITFRGGIKKDFTNPYVFLIISTLLFGFVHVIGGDHFDLINIFPYCSLGFFLAFIYYKTDNILASTIMHSFHNLLCILLLLFQGVI